jgi:hypothetical protein
MPEHFLVVDGQMPTGFQVESVMQQLDDCDETLTFEKVNIYTTARITLGKERVLRHVILPYRVSASSRSYTLYERV